MAKIYTKTGDKGDTGLFGGKRVGKDSARICAYGDIDELNAVLGLCRKENDDPGLERILHMWQKGLFVLGADLATPLDRRALSFRRIDAAHVKRLEEYIDALDAKLPALNNFILPSGSGSACFLHLARTVCRRVERSLVALTRKEKVNTQVPIYLNRLGDLLFVMARTADMLANAREEKIIL